MTIDHTLGPVGHITRGRYPSRSKAEAAWAATADPHALIRGETIRLPHTRVIVTVCDDPNLTEISLDNWTLRATVRAAAPVEQITLQQIELLEASMRWRASSP